MKLMRKAACAAVWIAATMTWGGCNATFRPVATPLPVVTGNPSGPETEAVLEQCPTPGACRNGETGIASDSDITAIDVSGDSNSGDRQLQNQVGSVSAGTVSAVNAAGSEQSVSIPATPIAFDYSRTSVFTANTATDSVTQLNLNTAAGGFGASTTTIKLPPGSAPIGLSFQYFLGTSGSYSQEYVVDAGSSSGPLAASWLQTCASGGGAISVITQANSALQSTICVGVQPVFAWIYWDQSKVFVLDEATDQAYVVSAGKYDVTNTIYPCGSAANSPCGNAPIKLAQSKTGQYLYVLNSGADTISVIDGQEETVVAQPNPSGPGTVNAVEMATLCPICSAPPIDIAQDPNFNDTSTNTQVKHVWVLHADGTVSVWDGSVPGKLTWITALPTITPAQAEAGAYPTNIALLRDGTYAYVGIGNTDQIVAINTGALVSGAITPGVNAGAGAATTSITVGVQGLGTARTPLAETLTNTVTEVNAATGAVTDVQTYSATVPVAFTVPVVDYVAVSRQGTLAGGNSADLSKVYAGTSTSTTYFCYDETVAPADCGTLAAPVPDVWAFGNNITTVTTGAPPILPPPLPASTSYLVSGCVNNGNDTMTCSNLYNGTSVVTAAANGSTPVNTYVTTIPSPPTVSGCNPGNPETGEYDGQKNCPAMIPEMVLGRS